MPEEIRAIVGEIQAAMVGLRETASAGLLAEIGVRALEWRRVVCGQAEGAARDQAIWALMGAERCLGRAGDLASTTVPDALLRLEAALRALRAMEELPLEVLPDPR